jgi:hypothetical protein
MMAVFPSSDERPARPWVPSGQGFYPAASGQEILADHFWRFRERLLKPWEQSKENRLDTIAVRPAFQKQQTDTSILLWIVAIFYSSMLASLLFWWALRHWRLHQAKSFAVLPDSRIVPDSVLQLGEERWAKRVLGLRTPGAAELTRYSNATVEVNFHMQLRAIYKLVLEWRRQENGWTREDRRLVEDETDPWLNGLDEFASLVGIYMRWVIKAGTKDGFRQTNVLAENEDSNHIWARLLMYFSEYYWGLLAPLTQFNNTIETRARGGTREQIEHLLTSMGLRNAVKP